jgi:hypothetical protein
MDGAAASFRMAFLPMWRVATEWSAGITVILIAVSGLIAGGVPIALHLAVFALAAAVGGVVVALAIALYRLELTSKGLHCGDAYGLYRVARWGAITRVRPVNFLGLRYLRVYSTDTPRPRWLPLFLSDMPGFAAEVERLAGPDHPLVLALR